VFQSLKEVLLLVKGLSDFRFLRLLFMVFGLPLGLGPFKPKLAKSFHLIIVESVGILNFKQASLNDNESLSIDRNIFV
jgi:hypothetical protein